MSPKYSVLISSRNEGTFLQRTVDDVLARGSREALEIVVIDDASSDESADVLDSPAYRDRGVRLMRNELRQGVIASRATAADHADGEYLCVLDAHSCGAAGWLDRLAGALATIGGRGLVVPAVYTLDPERWEIDDSLPPALACGIANPYLDFEWTAPRVIDGRSCTCTIAGGAWMATAQWYRHIGGLDRDMRFWGGENIDLPIRTWLAGGMCLVEGSARVGHIFKKPNRAQPNATGSDVTYNKIRLAHTIFAADTFHRVLNNLRGLPGFAESLARLKRDSKSVGYLKGHIEQIRQRSDAWLFETFELPVLEWPVFFRPKRRVQHLSRQPPRNHKLVTVVTTNSGKPTRLEELARSVLRETTYSRYRLLLASHGARVGDFEFLDALEFREDGRWSLLQSTSVLSGSGIYNLAAAHEESEILVFLDDTVTGVEPHWLEKTVLLFERCPHLLLASPRLAAASDESAAGTDRFDVQWDFDRSGWWRQRVGAPLCEDPYQALGVPATCFAVHRERLLELGGFDRTVTDGAPPLLDLAIHGWLAGYEVMCHPGIKVTFERRGADCSSSGDAADQYAQVLPTAKYFTNESRRDRCRARCPEAEPLLERHRFFVGRRRREFLEYARFDEDWLFYKFGIAAP